MIFRQDKGRSILERLSFSSWYTLSPFLPWAFTKAVTSPIKKAMPHLNPPVLPILQGSALHPYLLRVSFGTHYHC